jgi:hypothetical protein
MAVLCPTYVGRCGADEHAAHAGHLLDRVAEVRAALPELPLLVLVAMQWAPGQEEEARRRVERLGALAAERGLPYAGATLPGPGKVRNVNAAIRLAAPLRLRGWLWVDDDIRMEEGCLARLVARFAAKGFRGAVGASKISDAGPHRAAHWLKVVKGFTAPPRAHPAACCMAVESGVLAGGIPAHRITDDAYVCFSLIDPAAADPYHLLETLPDARCRVQVGGKAGETLRNLRRNLFSHIHYMADARPGVARAYLTHSLLHGLWPLAPWDGRKGVRHGAGKWLFKAAYLGWLSAEAAVLAGRGLVGRPRRSVSWGAYTAYTLPRDGGR